LMFLVQTAAVTAGKVVPAFSSILRTFCAQCQLPHRFPFAPLLRPSRLRMITGELFVRIILEQAR
jgi:hypothetical protein